MYSTLANEQSCLAMMKLTQVDKGMSKEKKKKRKECQTATFDMKLKK